MEWIDSHTHLYAKAFNNDRDEMIARAISMGVERFLMPNIDSESIEGMLALEEKYPDRCFPMMGLHPCSVKANYKEELAIVREWLEKRPFLAVGEIGIDLYWDKTHVEEQKAAFIKQAEWAVEFDIPIVIHSRESIDILVDLVQQIGDTRLRGVFHCFTGTVQQAEAIMKLGFYLGLGGVLTFKNGGVDKTMAEIGLERVILETDAPYLSPVPHRGKRNESSYVPLVAQKLAEVKQMELKEIAAITTENTCTLFTLPHHKSKLAIS